MEMEKSLEKIKLEQVCAVCKCAEAQSQPATDYIEIKVDGVPFELINNPNNLMPNDDQEMQVSQEIEKMIEGMSSNSVHTDDQSRDDASDVDSDVVRRCLDEMKFFTDILSPMEVDIPCTTSNETQTLPIECKTSSTQVNVSLTDAAAQTIIGTQFTKHTQTEVISQTIDIDSQTDKMQIYSTETQTDLHLVDHSEETNQDIDVNMRMDQCEITGTYPAESNSMICTCEHDETPVPKHTLLTIETQTDMGLLEENKKVEFVNVELQTDPVQLLENGVETIRVKSAHEINKSLREIEMQLKILENQHCNTSSQTDDSATINERHEETKFKNAKTPNDLDRQATAKLMNSEDLLLAIQNLVNRRFNPDDRFDVLNRSKFLATTKLPTFNKELLLQRDNRNLSKRLTTMNKMKRLLKSHYNDKLKKYLKFFISLNHFNKCCKTNDTSSRVFDTSILPKEEIINDFENYPCKNERINNENQATLEEQALKCETAVIQPFSFNNNAGVQKECKDASCQNDDNLEELELLEDLRYDKQNCTGASKIIQHCNKKRKLGKIKSNKTPTFKNIFGSDSDSSSTSEQNCTNSKRNRLNTCFDSSTQRRNVNTQKTRSRVSKSKYTKAQFNNAKDCLLSNSYDIDSTDAESDVTESSKKLQFKPKTDICDTRPNKSCCSKSNNETKLLKQLKEHSISLQNKQNTNDFPKVINETQTRLGAIQTEKILPLDKSIKVNLFENDKLSCKSLSNVCNNKELESKNQKHPTLDNKIKISGVFKNENVKVNEDRLGGKKRIAHIPKHRQNNINEVLHKTNEANLNPIETSNWNIKRKKSDAKVVRDARNETTPSSLSFSVTTLNAQIPTNVENNKAPDNSTENRSQENIFLPCSTFGENIAAAPLPNLNRSLSPINSCIKSDDMDTSKGNQVLTNSTNDFSESFLSDMSISHLHQLEMGCESSLLTELFTDPQNTISLCSPLPDVSNSLIANSVENFAADSEHLPLDLSKSSNEFEISSSMKTESAENYSIELMNINSFTKSSKILLDNVTKAPCHVIKTPSLSRNADFKLTICEQFNSSGSISAKQRKNAKNILINKPNNLISNSLSVETQSTPPTSNKIYILNNIDLKKCYSIIKSPANAQNNNTEQFALNEFTAQNTSYCDVANISFDYNDCPSSPPPVEDGLCLPVLPVAIPLERISEIPTISSLESTSVIPLETVPKVLFNNKSLDLVSSVKLSNSQKLSGTESDLSVSKTLMENNLPQAGVDASSLTALTNDSSSSGDTGTLPLKRYWRKPSVNKNQSELDEQKLAKVTADKLLTILIGFQTSYDTELEIAKKLKNVDAETIARATIDCILKCIHSKSAEKRRPKKIYVSEAQKKLLGFLVLLKELKGNANFMSTILDRLESRIVQSKSARFIESMSAFYIAYCMLYSNVFRVRLFIIKALYKMQNHVLPLLYTTISNWMAVFIEYKPDSPDILTRGVVQVIRTRTSNDPILCDYNVVALLCQCLKYPMEPDKTDVLVMDLLCGYFVHPDVCSKYVIIMLCQKMHIKNVCSTIQMAILKMKTKLRLNETKNVIGFLEFIFEEFKKRPGITNDLEAIYKEFKVMVEKAELIAAS